MVKSAILQSYYKVIGLLSGVVIWVWVVLGTHVSIARNISGECKVPFGLIYLILVTRFV